jgi:hypothetical protein
MFALTVEEYQSLMKVADGMYSAATQLSEAHRQLYKNRGLDVSSLSKDELPLSSMLYSVAGAVRGEVQFVRGLLGHGMVVAPDGNKYEGRNLPADVLAAPTK